MKILFRLSTAIGICAIATSVNAGNVADADIVTFTANTAAKASEVNANFTKLKVENNDNDARITTNTNALAGATFFYGDGSAGNLTVSTSANWNSAPPTNYNLNFGNVTIDALTILTVPAGTTIRCNGSFTNNGTINVSTGTAPSSPYTWALGASAEFYSIGHPGDSLQPASGGSYDNTNGTKTLYYGAGGAGIPPLMAATSFATFRHGGGSGSGPVWGGGHGGGLLKIYCKGVITNAGTITANGDVGSGGSAGGGGGGIVVLASTTSVTVTGTINLKGGNGAPSYSYGGAGGGGGGGIGILVAPAVDATAATTDVSGGTVGSNTTAVTNATGRIAGSGGGASGGNGGIGSQVSAAASGVSSGNTNGSAGYILELEQNPIYLMH